MFLEAYHQTKAISAQNNMSPPSNLHNLGLTGNLVGL